MNAAEPVIRLSSPATRESWAVPVVYEDDHLLAIDKPSRLLSSPDRYDPQRPNLMRMLLDGVAQQRPWAASRGLQYLANAHRLDFETTGVLLLAKTRPALVALANHFGSEIPRKTYVALACGYPPEDEFTVDAPLSQDRFRPGVMRVSRAGKRSCTDFRVRERFTSWVLLEASPRTGRTHQIRVHLKHAGFPILSDRVYGGMELFLSSLKPRYHRSADKTERPLLSSIGLHAWKLELPHPITGERVNIEAPWPREFEVALKYLRRYAPRPGGIPAKI